MKIAIMMRAIDQDSGFHLYIKGLIDALLKFETDEISYLLIYRTKKWFGSFNSNNNVKEILVNAPNKFLWDQVAAPYSAWKNNADIIFNPKITVPLISHCPVVIGLQEPAWYVLPEFYEKFNVKYQKFMLPLYLRKAAHLFPMAQWVIDENRKYINLPFDNASITYPGVPEHLKVIEDKIELENFRKKYNLPEKFILSMSRVDNPGMDKSKKWNPSQNPHTTLKAFLLCKDKIPHHAVFAGRNVKQYFLDMGFTEKDFDRVHFVDFVPFNEIQNLYSLADIISIPVFYESFSFTLLGAMACGCPAVVSNTGAFSEIIGNAGLFADPNSPRDLAEKFLDILTNEDLKRDLRHKGLERAAIFTWERTAKDTLKGLIEATHSEEFSNLLRFTYL